MKCIIGDVVECLKTVPGYFGTIGMQKGDRGIVIGRYLPKGRKTPSSLDIKVYGRKTVRAVPVTDVTLVKEGI